MVEYLHYAKATQNRLQLKTKVLYLRVHPYKVHKCRVAYWPILETRRFTYCVLARTLCRDCRLKFDQSALRDGYTSS